MRVLVTGANGLVGRQLLLELAAQQVSVRAAVRGVAQLPGTAERHAIADLESAPDWTEALRECDAVVHLAARVHMMRDRAADPAAAYQRVNTEATLGLARQAAAAGVRRFVFLSSIKVNGEVNRDGQPFRPADEAHPADPYAWSKHQAELGLRQLERESGLQVAIVRPPLVYGPGVKANFLRLLRAISRGRPLPLGRVHNRRSLVSVWNLADLLVRLALDPRAVGRTWMVSDGEDLSTPELITRLAAAMGREARLLPVPLGALRLGAALAGRGAELRRVLGTLTVDASDTRTLLQWSPPIGVDEGLRRTAAWFASQARP
jgi:nucleoside-diphosphate-sugar epimerase